MGESRYGSSDLSSSSPEGVIPRLPRSNQLNTVYRSHFFWDGLRLCCSVLEAVAYERAATSIFPGPKQRPNKESRSMPELLFLRYTVSMDRSPLPPLASTFGSLSDPWELIETPHMSMRLLVDLVIVSHQTADHPFFADIRLQLFAVERRNRVTVLICSDVGLTTVTLSSRSPQSG